MLNPEINWNVGAFNMNADPMNFLDFGWGVYDPMNMQVVGTTVYVVALRSGAYKKIKINSLSFAYEFVYADLDGANEQTITIDRADHADKVLAYYSLENDAMVDVEPASWDLLFARYGTLADNGAGVELENYEVTGVLSGLNVQVAKAEGVVPGLADSTNYSNDYETQIDIVGHDWKYFDLAQFEWIISDDVAYFVKTADGEVCRLFFIDFEGSSTGVITLQKDCANPASSTKDELALGVESFDIFPNPSNGAINLVLDLATAKNARVEIYNMMGQRIQTAEIELAAGLTAHNLNVAAAPGRYQVVMNIDAKQIVRPLIITH